MGVSIRERPEVVRQPNGDLMETTRTAEDYGDVKLSVQASNGHYCRPRIDGLNLSDYEAVEVAIIPQDDREGFLLPSEIGLPEFDHHWEDKDEDFTNPVAGWVPQGVVDEIRDHLSARQGEQTDG